MDAALPVPENFGDPAKPSTAPGSSVHAPAVRRLLGSASALMVAMGIERSCGFLSNVLAARIGGASSYGAYSLALTTANNIASYAGAGIGLTATRFSGEYPEGTRDHEALKRALILVSFVSAIVAAALLFWGAEPLARVLLHNPKLTSLLQIAALSSGAMIAFECCRGYLVGQRQLKMLVLLSCVMGIGVLIGLPLMAPRGPRPMVLTQALVSLAAISALALAGRAGLTSNGRRTASHEPYVVGGVSVATMAGRVWRFGTVQLAGAVGLNAAGWWVASLVARADSTLIQMGIFAVANQLRNLVALAPGLLAQSSYAMLSGKERETTEHVLAFSTFTAAAASIALGGLLIIPLPFVLPVLYGRSYAAGVLTASLSIATAIIHMASAPASARLSIVSLPLTGAINAIWAVLVAGFALAVVVPNGATGAASLYLGAHMVSAVLVMASLKSMDTIPKGMTPVMATAVVTSTALALVSWLRAILPGSQVALTALLFAIVCAAIAYLLVLGRQRMWIPSVVRLRSLAGSALRQRRFV